MINGKILVTGGMGFIGSHTYVALVNAGYSVFILDNLSSSDIKTLRYLKQITAVLPQFIQGDIRDSQLLKKIFSEHTISAVIHFAGLKSVADSVKQPLEYYDNNVIGTLNLLSAMRQANIKKFIFSSSATVYGNPMSVPVLESFPCHPVNPYGRTKHSIETILVDLQSAEPDWSLVSLRYFNPVGAHESGLIGENPRGTPNNLMPYILQVAAGQRDFLTIFGDDYPTCDGTGVRDYIHVMDLAQAHVAALEYSFSKKDMLTLNLGTGKPISVLQMIKTFEEATGKKIPYKVADRRQGDIAEYWADPKKAKQTLGWVATRNLETMCQDAWYWQQNISK